MSPNENLRLSRAETLAKDVLAAHAESVDREGRWPRESVAALAHSGLLGLTVPPQCGGAGEGPRTFANIVRTLAGSCASTAMIYLMHICGTQVIAAAEGFSEREEVLKTIAAGQHLTTLAFSEKGSRSHFWAPVSQATIQGTTHRLAAEKSFVTSAGQADSYIVSTRAAGLTDPMANTLYFVARGTAGVTVGNPWNGMGLRGNASSPMKLENVEVPTAHRVSREGEGFSAMVSTVLPWFLLGNAAVSVGLIRAAVAGTRQHLLAARLEHLGQSLADLPNLRARLAQMQIQADIQTAFLDHVAGKMEVPGPDTMLTVLESKATAAEAALQVTDLAMRTCGGAAFGRQLAVERNFRDARAGSVMAPTTDVLYDFVARSVLNMPLFGG